MRGLMMGRFQPFHMGHMDLVRQVLDECDEAIVAVTSSQFNYMKKDPFTAGERIEMIHAALAEERSVDAGRCYVVGLENQPNMATWASYLRSSLPRFDRVYSGNEYVAALLADAGIQVSPPAFLDRDRYNATRIRSMIIADRDGSRNGGEDAKGERGQDWKGLVPPAVYRYLAEIGAGDRLRVIAGSDTSPMEY